MKSLTYYLHKIRNFFMDIKWAVQTARRGYSDGDIYSIRDWFLIIMPKMLREFDRQRISHPCTMTDSEWGDILNRMAVLLERSNPDYWESKLSEDYTKEELLECFEQTRKHWDMFLDMWKEYFFDLWY